MCAYLRLGAYSSIKLDGIKACFTYFHHSAELMKKVNKKSGDSLEVRVIEALEDICSNPNFRSYDFSPPSTTKACKLLLGRCCNVLAFIGS